MNYEPASPPNPIVQQSIQPAISPLTRRRNLAVGLGLFLITLAVYWPATTFPFIAYDDQLYVYENPVVSRGFSWEGFRWLGTAVVCANWHPVTMLSHMADCAACGLFAGGHHLTSLLLHAVNTLLCWWLARRLTQSFWTGALVAALFAWHPLNVESVAWVAERKNVLSTFFLFLTLHAYLNYVAAPGRAKYFLIALWFSLGLMSKPMLVTLPCVLLLLDYWPLHRGGAPGKNWGRLFYEKWPLFFLAGAACAVTLLTQGASGAVKSVQAVPIAVRLANVPVAYVSYVAKLFWPEKLCVLYPLPEKIPGLAVVGGAGLLLLTATALFFHWRSKHRWLLVGWLIFLGTLVPVIGVVQVGEQAMADRYAYVPLLGLFLIIACGLREWARVGLSSRILVIGLACAALVACLFQTRRQLACWHSGSAVFAHALELNPQNATLHDLLAAVLSGSGQTNEAVQHYREAVRLKPNNSEFRYNLGRELIGSGNGSEAEIHLAEACRQTPGNPVYHNSLGVAFFQQGKTGPAGGEFNLAIKLLPEYPKPYFNLGKLEQQLGHDGAALTNFFKAVQLDPGWAEAWDRLALLRATSSQPGWQHPGEAVQFSRRANEITHESSPRYLQTLARAYAAAEQFSNAVAVADQAVAIARTNRLDILAGQIAEELKAYQAGRIPPTSPPEARP